MSHPSKLKITLVRSTIGYEKSQGATAVALGLKKRGSSVVQNDNPQVRGMIFKIKHLLEVSEVEAPAEGNSK
jgi:large subunit ribosomal protein L30